MNAIHFLITHHTLENGYQYSSVAINIDGKPLIEHMQAIEQPMAKRENNLLIAGAYSPIVLPKDPVAHFTGQTADTYYDNIVPKTTLLECECGVEGCWPLLCCITLEDNIVRWTAFEQPHRSLSRNSVRIWDYADLTFAFDKAPYLNALQQPSSRSLNGE